MQGFEKIHEILEQEIDRKEFLRYLGVGLLSLVGIMNLIHNLDHFLGTKSKTKTTASTSQKPSGGYGSSAYGS